MVVQPLRVGQVRSASIEVDGTGRSAGEIAEAIRALADRWLMLRVTVRGIAPLGEPLDLPQLEEELAPACYYMECNDARQLALSDEAMDDDAGPLLADYVRRIASANRRAEPQRSAASLIGATGGAALLQGRTL